MTVTGTAAGRVFWGVLRLLPVLWCCVFPADFLIVEMEGKIQTVLLNDNVTISCKVPGSTPLNTDITGVVWYVKHQAHGTEHEVFEMYGNHQQAFRPGASVCLAGLEKGDFSLHLPGVQLRDAGEYRCKVVVTPEQAQETVFLNVSASPECTLFQEQAMVKDDGDKYILCKACWLYTKDITITWYTWTQENLQGQEISEGITTGPAIKNEDGTFNITSRLRLGHNVITCQCVIRHISLSTSCRLNVTQFQRGSEMGNAWGTTLTYITTVGIVASAAAVAVAIIGLIRCFKKRKRLPRRHELPQEEPEELELRAFTKVHS